MPFPTTRWSLLAQATLTGGPAENAAWAEFYLRYRAPVLDFIRRQTADSGRAEDLAQEFFLHLIESSTLRRADPARGRFRSFLLGALTRFLARTRAAQDAGKRGGGAMPLSLDALPDDADGPAVPADVALAFDREWARGLLTRARCEVEADWRVRRPANEITLLARYLPGAVDTPAYADAAKALGWPLARLKTEVFRLRREFRERVRAAVALTVDAPHEVEAELAHLHAVLADPTM